MEMHYKDVKALLSPQNGMNLYLGCEHGLLCCDKHNKCYKLKQEFDDIEVKAHAEDLLEHTLKRKRTRGMITTGAMTDPYLPLEKDLMVTRRCLNQIERFDFGLTIQTKSELVLRDLEVLEKINRKTKCVVVVPITNFDDEICRKVEPNTTTAKQRFEILNELHKRGIPTIVQIGPFLPFINDDLDNLKNILDLCVKASVYGVLFVGYHFTLREEGKEFFAECLDKQFPGISEKYVEYFADTKEYVSPNFESLMQMLRSVCEENGIVYDREELQRFMREYKNKTIGEQLSIFDFES